MGWKKSLVAAFAVACLGFQETSPQLQKMLEIEAGLYEIGKHVVSSDRKWIAALRDWNNPKPETTPVDDPISVAEAEKILAPLRQMQELKRQLNELSQSIYDLGAERYEPTYKDLAEVSQRYLGALTSVHFLYALAAHRSGRVERFDYDRLSNLNLVMKRSVILQALSKAQKANHLTSLTVFNVRHAKGSDDQVELRATELDKKLAEFAAVSGDLKLNALFFDPEGIASGSTLELRKNTLRERTAAELTEAQAYARFLKFIAVEEMFTNRWSYDRMWSNQEPKLPATKEFLSFRFDPSKGLESNPFYQEQMGYDRLTQFNETSVPEIHQALSALPIASGARLEDLFNKRVCALLPGCQDDALANALFTDASSLKSEIQAKRLAMTDGVPFAPFVLNVEKASFEAQGLDSVVKQAYQWGDFDATDDEIARRMLTASFDFRLFQLASAFYTVGNKYDPSATFDQAYVALRAGLEQERIDYLSSSSAGYARVLSAVRAGRGKAAEIAYKSKLLSEKLETLLSPAQVMLPAARLVNEIEDRELTPEQILSPAYLKEFKWKALLGHVYPETPEWLELYLKKRLAKPDLPGVGTPTLAESLEKDPNFAKLFQQFMAKVYLNYQDGMKIRPGMADEEVVKLKDATRSVLAASVRKAALELSEDHPYAYPAIKRDVLEKSMIPQSDGLIVPASVKKSARKGDLLYASYLDKKAKGEWIFSSEQDSLSQRWLGLYRTEKDVKRLAEKIAKEIDTRFSTGLALKFVQKKAKRDAAVTFTPAEILETAKAAVAPSVREYGELQGEAIDAWVVKAYSPQRNQFQADELEEGITGLLKANFKKALAKIPVTCGKSRVESYWNSDTLKDCEHRVLSEKQRLAILADYRKRGISPKLETRMRRDLGEAQIWGDQEYLLRSYMNLHGAEFDEDEDKVAFYKRAYLEALGPLGKVPNEAAPDEKLVPRDVSILRQLLPGQFRSTAEKRALLEHYRKNGIAEEEYQRKLKALVPIMAKRDQLLAEDAASANGKALSEAQKRFDEGKPRANAFADSKQPIDPRDTPKNLTSTEASLNRLFVILGVDLNPKSKAAVHNSKLVPGILDQYLFSGVVLENLTLLSPLFRVDWTEPGAEEVKRPLIRQLGRYFNPHTGAIDFEGARGMIRKGIAKGSEALNTVLIEALSADVKRYKNDGNFRRMFRAMQSTRTLLAFASGGALMGLDEQMGKDVQTTLEKAVPILNQLAMITMILFVVYFGGAASSQVLSGLAGGSYKIAMQTIAKGLLYKRVFSVVQTVFIISVGARTKLNFIDEPMEYRHQRTYAVATTGADKGFNARGESSSLFSWKSYTDARDAYKKTLPMKLGVAALDSIGAAFSIASFQGWLGYRVPAMARKWFPEMEVRGWSRPPKEALLPPKSLAQHIEESGGNVYKGVFRKVSEMTSNALKILPKYQPINAAAAEARLTARLTENFKGDPSQTLKSFVKDLREAKAYFIERARLSRVTTTDLMHNTNLTSQFWLRTRLSIMRTAAKFKKAGSASAKAQEGAAQGADRLSGVEKMFDKYKDAHEAYVEKINRLRAQINLEKVKQIQRIEDVAMEVEGLIKLEPKLYTFRSENTTPMKYFFDRVQGNGDLPMFEELARGASWYSRVYTRAFEYAKTPVPGGHSWVPFSTDSRLNAGSWLGSYGGPFKTPLMQPYSNSMTPALESFSELRYLASHMRPLYAQHVDAPFITNSGKVLYNEAKTAIETPKVFNEVDETLESVLTLQRHQVEVVPTTRAEQLIRDRLRGMQMNPNDPDAIRVYRDLEIYYKNMSRIDNPSRALSKETQALKDELDDLFFSASKDDLTRLREQLIQPKNPKPGEDLIHDLNNYIDPRDFSP